jgi:hypothetical protein
MMFSSELPSGRSVLIAAAALIVLAVVPYIPFFALPHISDDYVQIELGRNYGPSSGWLQLAGDALYRCRATSILLTNWTEQLFGASSAVFQAESTVLHVLNTLLVAALGLWRPIGWRLAVLAAGFFAVHEGHQEAVVWYAAVPELLVFLFALLALHVWLRWLDAGRSRPLLYGLALALFILALLSKESAVAVVPLMAGAGYLSGKPVRAIVRDLLPFAAVSVLYALAIFAAKGTHLHLNDGTFAPGSHVAAVVARSTGRLLWVWGVLALAFLAMRSRLSARRLLLAASAWILITLLPYSFLSYMPYVPSRHVYWASVGLAFLVSGALLELWETGWRHSRALAIAAAGVILVHNCAYLWIKKYPQYERRAAPTERLVSYSERVKGPITVKCFPYSPEIAALTLKIRAGRPVESTLPDPDAKAGEGVYCDPEQP